MSRFRNSRTYMRMEPWASVSSAPNSPSLVLALSMYGLLFMGGLLTIRTQMREANQSAFEINGNGMFMIIAIVASFAVEVTSGILFFTNIYLHHKCYYTILKFIDIFLAYLAPFLLMMVLDLSKWMVDLLSYVFMVITIANVCSNDDDNDDVDYKNHNKSSPFHAFAYLGLVLVPLLLVFVLYIPRNLDWIVYSVMYLYIVMGVVHIFIFVNSFNYLNEEKETAQNLEAHQEIQQDKNNINDLEAQQLILIQQDKNNNH